MTQRWAYVGELGAGGGLDWGGDKDGNIPVSGRLPDLGDEAFWAILKLASAGAFDGRQVDWGAWAIKVNGPQLREVLASIYGDLSQHAGGRVAAYLAFADELGGDCFVAFVAAEL